MRIEVLKHEIGTLPLPSEVIKGGYVFCVYRGGADSWEVNEDVLQTFQLKSGESIEVSVAGGMICSIPITLVL